MMASEVLADAERVRSGLEARAEDVINTLSILDGLRSSYSSAPAGRDILIDRIGMMIARLEEQEDRLEIELDNLVASQREVYAMLDRIKPEHNAILSYVHLAGHTIYEYSKRYGVKKRNAYNIYNKAIDELNSISRNKD